MSQQCGTDLRDVNSQLRDVNSQLRDVNSQVAISDAVHASEIRATLSTNHGQTQIAIGAGFGLRYHPVFHGWNG